MARKTQKQPAQPVVVQKSTMADIAAAAGIPKSIQDIMAKAGQVIGVGPGGATMTLSMNTNGDFDTDVDVEEQEKPKVIGRFKPKTTFHDFIATVGNVNVLSKEATLDGKFFDSLNLEGVKFKITLCDDNTFDIEEIGTNLVTEEEMRRYVTLFDDSPVSGFRDRSVLTDFVFVATHTVKEKSIQLESYLVVDQVKPYNQLLDFLSDEDEEQNSTLEEVTIAVQSEQTSETPVEEDFLDERLRDIFGDDEPVAQKAETPVPNNAWHPEPITSVSQQVAQEFLEAKKKNREKLLKKVENYTEDLKKAQITQHTAFTKIRECNDEIKLLQSRIDSLEINEPFNGYYYYVPVSETETSYLDEATRTLIFNKLVSMNYQNADSFMKIFDNDLFQIRIGLDTDNGLVELTDFKNVVSLFKNFDLDMNSKIYVKDGSLFYEGQLEWADVCNKLVKLGFKQNPQFDQMFAIDEDAENNDNYISEQIAEYEEEMGYEMGNEFLFSILYEPSNSNEIGDPQICIGITPKSYFDNEGCTYDQHIQDILCHKFPMIAELGDHLEEVEEGAFDLFSELDMSEGNITGKFADLTNTIDILCKAGLKFSAKYQDFMSSKDSALVQYVISTLGHNSSII